MDKQDLVKLIITLITPIIIAIEINIIPKYFSLTFSEMLLMIAISVLIPTMILVVLYRKKQLKWMLPWKKQKIINEYISSLSNELETLIKKRSIDFHIEKISESVKVRRWCGQISEYYGESRTLMQILDGKESFLAIIGAGGTGKTFTLWKWIIDTCEKLDKSSEKARIPIYVPLANLGEYKNLGLKKRIRNIILRREIIAPIFDQLLKEGRLFFIFDGFNEICHGLDPNSSQEFKRTYFQKATNELCDYWRDLHEKGCKVVVISREYTLYFEKGVLSFFSDEDFYVYVVEPFLNDDITAISKNYLQNDANQFIAELKEKEIDNMVKDALSLSIAIQVFQKEDKLPIPLKFYKTAALIIIEKNLIRRGIRGKEEINAILEILMDVSYDVIKNYQSGAYFPGSLIESKFALHPVVRLDHFIECEFLEKTDSNFRFWQQHWNEVFAALKIKKSDNLELEIQNKITDERWYDTLVVLSRCLEESDTLINSAIKNENFILAAKIIKNASIIKNKDIISTFLLDLIFKLNDVRLLTCRERLNDPDSAKYDKILHTFFKVVEILGDLALKPFLGMCIGNRDPLVRAQAIYFIEEERKLLQSMTEEDTRSILELLKKETNIHVIFHILIVLEELLKSKAIKDEISKQILESMSRWGDLTQLEATLILHRNKLVSSLILDKYTKEELKSYKERAMKLLEDLRKFDEIQLTDRKDEFNNILERVELSLWLIAELAKEKRINLDDALELFSRALNEKSSPFWIVRWWAIFNLRKIEAQNARELLLENVKDPLPDIGLLCIKSLWVSEGGETYIQRFCEWAKSIPQKELEERKLSGRLKEAEEVLKILSKKRKSEAD